MKLKSILFGGVCGLAAAESFAGKPTFLRFDMSPYGEKDWRNVYNKGKPIGKQIMPVPLWAYEKDGKTHFAEFRIVKKWEENGEDCYRMYVDFRDVKTHNCAYIKCQMKINDLFMRFKDLEPCKEKSDHAFWRKNELFDQSCKTELIKDWLKRDLFVDLTSEPIDSPRVIVDGKYIGSRSENILWGTKAEMVIMPMLLGDEIFDPGFHPVEFRCD